MGIHNSKSSFKNSLSNEINFVHSGNSEVFDISNSKGQKGNQVLTTFIWSYGGNNVMLTGSFDNWKKKIPMERQGYCFLKKFISIIDYKFIVDGEWRFSPEDNPTSDENGFVNNMIDTTNYKPILKDDKQKKEKQEEDDGPKFEKNKVNVPKIPENLKKCSYLITKKNVLSQNPKYVESSSEMQEQNQRLQFQTSLTEEEINFMFKTPHVLSMPTHVTLGHIMTTKEEWYTAMGITQRCKEKYTTYIYYNVNK